MARTKIRSGDITDGIVTASKLSETAISDKLGYAPVSPDDLALLQQNQDAYIQFVVEGIIDSAPQSLDTLNELAAALNDDANFASTVTNQLALKANISSLATVATSGSYNDLTNKPTLFSGSYNDLTNKPDLSVYQLASSAFSGNYNDLTNKPDLSVYQLASSAFSGNYNDLTNKPTLFSGSYNDLTDKPDLSVYQLASTAFSGNYTDLTNKPDLSVYQLSSTAFSGNYTDLTNKPDLFSGSYNDLTNKPSLATVATSGLYNDLIDKPSLFSGSYNDLTNKPSLATVATSGSYNDLTDKPTSVDLTYITADTGLIGNVSIVGNTIGGIDSYGNPTSTTFSNDVLISNDLVINGDLTVNGVQNIINTTNLAVEDNMIYLNDGSTVTNPDLGFSGNYNDGSYKHTGLFRDATDGVWKFYDSYTLEPDASPYIDINHASFSYADVRADKFYGDGSSLTNISYTNLTNKPSLATVATTGSYNDLTDKPTLFSGSYNDLTDKPTFLYLSGLNITGPITANGSSGSFGQVLTSGSSGPAFWKSLATVATSGSYNDLTDKPTIPTLSAITGDVTSAFNGMYNLGSSSFKWGELYLNKLYLYNSILLNGSAGTSGQVLRSNGTSAPSWLSLATVATSGSYTDLTNRPSLATVATSGSYNNLTDKPTIPDFTGITISSGKLGVGVTPTTALDISGAISQNVVVTGAGSLNFNCSQGNYFTKTVQTNETYTVTNVPSSRVYCMVIFLNMTGSYAITWWSGIKWPANTAPSLTSGKKHAVVLFTDDGGTTWNGSYILNYNQ